MAQGESEKGETGNNNQRLLFQYLAVKRNDDLEGQIEQAGSCGEVWGFLDERLEQGGTLRDGAGGENTVDERGREISRETGRCQERGLC